MPRQTKLSLVSDASMSGVELSGFYQTPNHMAMKAIRAKLTSADWCVWSYLQMIDPYGDRFVDIPNHKEIAEIVGLSEKSVKRSIYKLEELGFYDTEVLAMKGKNLAGNALRAKKKTDKVVQPETKLSSQRQSCPARDKVVQPETKLSSQRQSCPNEASEPLHSKDSENTHTLNTYSDFIQTLSEDERANFLNFVREKTKNLSQEVNDIEAWLASSNKAGQNRWEVYYSKYLDSKKTQSQKPAINNALDEHRRELERQQQQAQKAWEQSKNQNQE